LEITNTSTIDEDARVRCAVLKRHLPALGPATALRSFPGGKFAIGRGLWPDGTVGNASSAPRRWDRTSEDERVALPQNGIEDGTSPLPGLECLKPWERDQLASALTGSDRLRSAQMADNDDDMYSLERR